MKKSNSGEYELPLFYKDSPWRVFELDPPDKRGGAFFTNPHWANSVEFVLCDGIRGMYQVDERRHSFDGRCVMYAPPGAVHSLDYYEGAGQILVAKFSLSEMKKYMDIEMIFSLGTLEAGDECHNELRGYIVSLCDPSLSLADKLVSVLRLFGLLSPRTFLDSDSSRRSPGLSYDEFRHIIDYTEANLHRSISLDEIAAELGYNKTYFCAKFKDTNHTTYISYLNAARIRRACKLLGEGEPPLRVAGECGFQNESYFIKLFREQVGITPGRWQRSIMNTED